MLSQAELSRVWGVSPSYVARLVKKGCPLSSVAEADRWRLENLQKPPRSESGASFVSSVAKPSEVKAEVETDTTTAGRLKRAHNAELLAYSLLQTLAKGGNAVSLRAGVHAWGEAKRRVSEAELEHAKHQQITRELVPTEEVRETSLKFLGGLRASMDALASSVCVRANPSDPQCAKEAIEEAVNHIYRQIQNCEGAFAYDKPPKPISSTA
jgi:hypothetical protein